MIICKYLDQRSTPTRFLIYNEISFQKFPVNQPKKKSPYQLKIQLASIKQSYIASAFQTILSTVPINLLCNKKLAN